MDERYIEYGCIRCKTHIPLPPGKPSPGKCPECGSTVLVRRILGPLELRRQLNQQNEQIRKLWFEFERLDKTIGEVVGSIREMATELLKQEEKLNAFIKAHDENPYEETSH
jgi:DNA-directed RNA polymerase subunit RPC12/RpoP